jgi:hypothetical protein
MVKKLTYEYTKNYFTKQGCELLETEYINSKTKMKYKCKCGNESYITWDSFKQGKRCMKCGCKEKLTFEYVKNYFKEQDCELLEKEYINANTKMNYICKCKNKSIITFAKFQKGNRCMKCSPSKKLTFEYVKNYFKEHNCELLETEYINTGTRMKYKCHCGNKSYIVFDSFKVGNRCINCGWDKLELNKIRFKDYTFPSGLIKRIQGYENIALDELVEKFKEDDIITNRRYMPKIIYKFKGKEHRYYPDIWIKSINKIIEVKSCYTYKKELIKNINKALFTRKLNFEFEFWIYTPESKNII